MQTPVEFDVTDLTPSPVVLTVAVKPPPKVPLLGRFEIDGVLGVPFDTVSDTVFVEFDPK